MDISHVQLKNASAQNAILKYKNIKYHITIVNEEKLLCYFFIIWPSLTDLKFLEF